MLSQPVNFELLPIFQFTLLQAVKRCLYFKPLLGIP
jgi:hypothetical protein